MADHPPAPTTMSLAIERTLLAHERTLIAWIRTATSLISFGFTIYKFFDYANGNGATPVHRLVTPRDFAMAMIGTGLVSLVLAIVGHARSRTALRASGVALPPSLALIMAGFIAVLGVLGFAVAVFRA